MNNKKPLPRNAVLIPEHAECVFQGVIFDVYQWQQEMYDGSLVTFEMLRRPDTVHVIAIKEDDSIITLQEEQPGGISRDISLPGGRVDPGEGILAAAKRELREETGVEFSDWKLIEVKQPELKIEWFVYLFVATGKSDVEHSLEHDNGEKIQIMESTFDEFKEADHGKRLLSTALYSLSLEEIKNLPDLNS